MGARIFTTTLRMALLGASAAVFSLAGGCLSISTEQCSTSSDCGSGFVCSSNQICVKPAAVTPGGPVIIAGEGSGCTDTPACTAANGGRPSVCRNPGDPCVNLVTDACPVLVGDGWENPNALFVGSMSQSRTTDIAGTVYGDAQEAAMRLALTELHSAGGFGGGANGAKRPLVGLFCSVEALNSEAQRVSDSAAVVAHLHDQVGVSAIMMQDEHILAPALDAVRGKVFSMCTFCQTDLSAQDPDGFIWRAMSPFASQGAVWNAVSQDFEARIRANPAYGVGASGPIRVALTTAPNEYINGMAEMVTASVRFNGGKSVSENLPYFKRIEMDNWVKPNSSASVYQAAAQVAAHKPHIVYIANDIEGNRLLMPLIESLWSGSQPRPYYIMGTPQFGVETTNLVSTNENLRKRMVVIAPGPLPKVSEEVFSGFATRLPSALPPKYGNRFEMFTIVSPSYDGFYSLAYAIAAAPGPRPGPADIRQAFSRISSANAITVRTDPLDIPKALSALGAQQNIKLIGTFTDLPWDLNKHVVAGSNGAYCVDRDGSTGNAFLSGAASPYQEREGAPVQGSIVCF